MKKLLTGIVMLAASLCSYGQQPIPAQAGQTYVASQYTYLSNVTTANTTGASSVKVSPASVVSSTGQPFVPFNTNAPVVLDPNTSNSETVTPSSVTNCYAGSINCTLGGTFSHVHVSGSYVQSATFGLQEAVNQAITNGSGTVLIDSTWQGPSGSSLITAATGSTNVVIQDNRSGTPVFYQWNGSAYAIAQQTSTDTFPSGDVTNHFGSNVNNLNITTQFSNQQGGNTQSSALYGAASIGSGASTYQVNAVSGFIFNSSIAVNSVAGYFQAVSGASSTTNWALNTLCATAPSHTGQTCYGHELDVNANNVSDEIIGMDVTGAWAVQPTSGNTVAYEVTRPGTGYFWNNAFFSVSGAAEYSFVTGASAASGDSLPSQIMPFLSVDASGTVHQSTIQVNALGQFVFTPNAGQTTFSGSVTAAAFYPQTLAAGPNFSYFNDFVSAADTAGGTIGVAGTCGLSNSHADVNHPGNLRLVSDNVSGDGESCVVGTQPTIVSPQSAATWVWETSVFPEFLPGTQAGAYQAGLISAAGLDASPWTAGIGFYMSSANANADHWYCEYNTTYTDTGVTGTSAWTRLTMVQNGTDVLWYINGTQVCSVAVASLPTAIMYTGAFTSVALTSSANAIDVDYVNVQRAATR